MRADGWSIGPRACRRPTRDYALIGKRIEGGRSSVQSFEPAAAPQYYPVKARGLKMDGDRALVARCSSPRMRPIPTGWPWRKSAGIAREAIAIVKIAPDIDEALKARSA
jgi:hypothetical protein